MKTILITGASSGIGKATALRFQSEGWNVIATMRDPAAGADLAALDNVLVARLDVTDSASIAAAVEAGDRPFRPHRRPAEQRGLRRLWPARGVFDRAHPAAVRHQRHRAAGGDQGRAAAYAREPGGDDRQHLVHRRADHLPARHALSRYQVRGRRLVRGAAL